jgi:hypothetical protein
MARFSRAPAAAFAVLALLLLAGCSGMDSQSGAGSGKQPARRIAGPPGFVGEPFAGWVDEDRAAAPSFDFSKVIVGDHGVPGGHAVRAMDVWDDGKNWYVCVTHFAGNGGADIVDITDPTHPKHLSSVDSGTLNSDCQFTDDGKYLFLGPFNGNPTVDTVMKGRRETAGSVPVAGSYDVLGEGISIWDVQDKAAPKLKMYSESGIYHNLFTFRSKDLNGTDTDWVLQNRGQIVRKWDPKGPSLNKVGNTDTMIHDMAVGQHPVTGDWLLYTGKGLGLAVINMNDPTHPVTIGELAAERGHGGVQGWHDQEFSPQLIDGKAILVVGSETLGAQGEPYGIVDVSDPSEPVLIGKWSLPGDPKSPEPNFYTFSPHELGVWNGYVVTANYHAGIWLFDMGSPERLREPVTLGYYYTSEEPALHGAPQDPPFAFNPCNWGAYFDSRGYVVASDWSSGLYILKFEKTNTWSAPPNRDDA